VARTAAQAASGRSARPSSRGIAGGLSGILESGLPLVLVGDGDIGGLIGIHCRQETRVETPIVSIDGIALKEFDFVDVGALLETSRAVPVVIKSLVFPAAEHARGTGGPSR